MKRNVWMEFVTRQSPRVVRTNSAARDGGVRLPGMVAAERAGRRVVLSAASTIKVLQIRRCARQECLDEEEGRGRGWDGKGRSRGASSSRKAVFSQGRRVRAAVARPVVASRNCSLKQDVRSAYIHFPAVRACPKLVYYSITTSHTFTRRLS